MVTRLKYKLTRHKYKLTNHLWNWSQVASRHALHTNLGVIQGGRRHWSRRCSFCNKQSVWISRHKTWILTSQYGMESDEFIKVRYAFLKYSRSYWYFRRCSRLSYRVSPFDDRSDGIGEVRWYWCLFSTLFIVYWFMIQCDEICIFSRLRHILGDNNKVRYWYGFTK